MQSLPNIGASLKSSASLHICAFLNIRASPPNICTLPNIRQQAARVPSWPVSSAGVWRLHLPYAATPPPRHHGPPPQIRSRHQGTTTTRDHQTPTDDRAPPKFANMLGFSRVLFSHTYICPATCSLNLLFHSILFAKYFLSKRKTSNTKWTAQVSPPQIEFLCTKHGNHPTKLNFKFVVNTMHEDIKIAPQDQLLPADCENSSPTNEPRTSTTTHHK